MRILHLFIDKPDKVSISPEPNLNNGKLIVKEKENIGPYNCSADCNPPCTIIWKYEDTNGSLHDAPYNGHELSIQRVNRNISLFRCVAKYDQNDQRFRKKRNIELFIQCKYFSIFFLLVLYVYY